MKRFSLCFLLPALCSAVQAQGFLPPVSKSTTTVAVDTDSWHPLLIGEEVPKSLSVIDETGKSGSLMSYKSYLEVLVVVFFSPRCGQNDSEWPAFRRLNDRYKDWRVRFLAVNTSTPEMLSELAATLRKQKLPWIAVQDLQHAAVSHLSITATPEVLIIDESAILRYRGPIDSVPDALNAVISHTDPVAHPEPPLKGMCAL